MRETEPISVRSYLQSWAERYKDELENNIMPFWLHHGLDRIHGGVYTCLDRDGTLIDTTKSGWFQGRFGFICAFAYNNIEKRQEWLEASHSCIDFIEQHCIDADGRMFFEVKADGTPLRKRRYLFSECFAVIAMRTMPNMSRRQWTSSALSSVMPILLSSLSRNICLPLNHRDTR